MNNTGFLLKTFRLLSLIFCMIGFFFNCQAEDQTPSGDLGITLNDPLPTTAYDSTNSTLKTNIINYLREVANNNPNQILVGQNVGHADWEGSYLSDITRSLRWNFQNSYRGHTPRIYISIELCKG